MHDEQRLDEVRRGKLVFPDELTYGAGSPPPPRPVGREEGHEGRLGSGRPARNSR